MKVDYAAFTKDPQRVYFVELKTDLSSLEEDQIKYLETAKGIEVKNLLDGIIYMSKKSDYHQSMFIYFTDSAALVSYKFKVRYTRKRFQR